MEWRRSGLSVVTGVPAGRLPSRSLPVSRLGTLPLVTSADGPIPAFLRGWFGPDYRDELDIAVETDTVQYGFELLAWGVINGCVVVTPGIGEAVREGRIRDARGLRVLQLDDDVGPGREVLVGAFTRGGERASLDAAHPLDLVWDVLREQSEARRSRCPGSLSGGSRDNGRMEEKPLHEQSPKERPRPRDRDAGGRARNARPRDALGRPLPHGAPGTPRQPEGVVRSAAKSLTEAQELLDAGRPFHAHEVFEDAWKQGPEAERALWRGLAQLAVGLTHAARGNARGGARLLRRGADAVGGYTEGRAHGLDVPGVTAWARRLAGQVESAEEPVDPAAWAPRLRRPDV